MIEPITLRLPFALVADFNLAKLIAHDGRWSWARGRELLTRFELAAHEREFARALLRDERRLWLYRINQRCFCGDFAVVDMSPPLPRDRRLEFFELKKGELLRELAITGVRAQAVARAVAELAAGGVVTADSAATFLQGDDGAVLERLRG